jgi:integrase
VRLVLAGIRRTHGTAQEGKAPVLTADVRKMVDALPAGAIGVRDRALLLLGFAAALRRSELVGLDVGDVQETTDGLVVRIRKSKTDQEGAGRLVGVPYGSAPATCPVRALRAWLEFRCDVDPALFRHIDWHGKQHKRLTDKAVARLVKRAADRVGIDPATVAGHSLRAGLATSAAAANVPERVIALQTGHESMTMLRRYIREGALFVLGQNSAAAIGL